MTFRSALTLVSLGLLSNAALAFDMPGVPKLPAPTQPVCDPAKDPDCDGIVLTQPGSGNIYPDPTITADQAREFWDPRALLEAPDAIVTMNPERVEDVRVFVRAAWDRELMYYRQVLDHADPGEQADLGATMADLDGDRVLDLVVGIPHLSRVEEDAGALAVFYGPVLDRELDLDRPDAMIYGTVRGGELGLGVGRMAGEPGGADGLRANSPYEGRIYVIPAGSRLPEKLDDSFLAEDR